MAYGVASVYHHHTRGEHQRYRVSFVVFRESSGVLGKGWRGLQQPDGAGFFFSFFFFFRFYYTHGSRFAANKQTSGV
jgi:hypothetical protein